MRISAPQLLRKPRRSSTQSRHAALILLLLNTSCEEPSLVRTAPGTLTIAVQAPPEIKVRFVPEYTTENSGRIGCGEGGWDVESIRTPKKRYLPSPPAAVGTSILVRFPNRLPSGRCDWAINEVTAIIEDSTRGSDQIVAALNMRLHVRNAPYTSLANSVDTNCFYSARTLNCSQVSHNDLFPTMQPRLDNPVLIRGGDQTMLFAVSLKRNGS